MVSTVGGSTSAVAGAALVTEALVVSRATLVAAVATTHVAGNRATLKGESGRRTLDEETSALDLTDVVETDDTDVGTGEELLAELDLTENLLGVGASEHGELVHGPVTVVVVGDSGSAGETDARVRGDESLVLGSELNAGGESGVDKEVNLGRDLAVGEGGKVGHSLEELVVEGVPDPHGGLGSLSGRDGGGDASSLGNHLS